MSRYFSIILLAFLSFGFASAKNYSLEYDLKKGQTISYQVTYDNSSNITIQGIQDKTHVIVNFDIVIEVIKKEKSNYFLQMKISKIMNSALNGNDVLHQINSRTNTVEAASLRKIINQNILFTLTSNGIVEIQQDIDNQLKNINIDKTIYGVLNTIFSRQGLLGFCQNIFPTYPEKKIKNKDSWISHNTRSYNGLKTTYQNIFTTDKSNLSASIKRTGMYAEQAVNSSISSLKLNINIEGNEKTFLDLNLKNGLTNYGSTSSIFENKNNELHIARILNWKIKTE